MSETHSLNLLNNIYAFYQTERNWVHRTRASLELALVQGPLDFSNQSQRQQQQQQHSEQDDSSDESCAGGDEGSAPVTDASDVSTTTTTSTISSSSSDMAVIKQEDSDSLHTLSSSNKARRTALSKPPTDSRWLRRKKSFKLSLGPLQQKRPARPRLQIPHAKRGAGEGEGEVEPSAQLLTLFGELVDARIESCLRVSRLVQDSSARREVVTSW